MLSAKDSTFASDSYQADCKYHFEEMVYYIESCRSHLCQSQNDLLQFLRNLADLKELIDANER